MHGVEFSPLSAIPVRCELQTGGQGGGGRGVRICLTAPKTSWSGGKGGGGSLRPADHFDFFDALCAVHGTKLQIARKKNCARLTHRPLTEQKRHVEGTPAQT